ncbi:response regulator [Geomesophilobacter sediminis]|uniref:Response regulator n=1 Tax=Geomesophilobacter sediminis TaxID=2798584 RepID=A0A8J7JAV5_9BACT|nr:response regulator [Geomesophilobacter sediminis]MBJ6723578.1 response regulator [Geomesophilobacter sediminis]
MTVDTQNLNKPAPNPSHKRLGEIFVERALLTEASIQRLVEHAKSKNIRLGELLEVIGLVTPQELAEALATQYRCRIINDFAKYAFPQEVLRLIPMDVAVKNTIFPLKLDGGKLGLAVADPTQQELFEEIAQRTNVKVILYVSTRTEINKAIARHYLGQNITDPNANTILVVEDNELTRESVERILKKRGYAVATAVDGMDAFSKIFTLKPKLVITDKVMPKLGGYEFLYAIRNIPEFRYMPVILMTAAATPDEEKEALERGFFDFILKPVKEIGLMTRVQRAFQSSEQLYGKTG